MTTTKAGFGLVPIRKRGGSPNGGAQNRYRINPAGYSKNIFTGDPVTLVNGFIQVASAATDYALGVFMGCVFPDSNNGGRPKWNLYYPANTSTTANFGGVNIDAFILDDWDATFKIQCNASCSVGSVGLNAGVTVVAGSTTYGTSGYLLSTKSAPGTGAALLRIVEIYDAPVNGSNAFSGTDPFPIVEVQFAQHQNIRVSAGRN